MAGSNILSKFKQNFIGDLISSIDSPVRSISIEAEGSGYANGDAVVFTGDGISATAVVFTNDSGGVTHVAISNNGSYSVAPVLTISTIDGFGAQLRPHLDNDNFYVFAGRSKPFDNDPVPDPNYENDYDGFYFQHEQMYFGRKLSNTDVTFMARKFTWTPNTVYTEYDDKDRLMPDSEQFYVLTSDSHVFKCIGNKNGAPSSIEPANTQIEGLPATLSDGYRWKYLYTIPGVDNTKFMTGSYMPVRENTDVTAAAIDGGLFNIKVIAGGANYPTSAGQIAQIDGQKIYISGAASAQTNYYASCTLTTFGPDNLVTNRRIIQSYQDGSNRIIVVANTFNANQISAGFNYQIAPTLSIDGDGSNFDGYFIMNTSSQSIIEVEVIDPGLGYNSAAASALSGTGFGTGASLRPIISPKGGHGSDVYGELYCKHVGITGEFANSYGFPTGVTIRTVGLLKNPITYNSNVPFTSLSFDQTVSLSVANTTAQNFSLGETVVGNVSRARGAVAACNSSIVIISGYRGTFLPGEILNGQDSKVQYTFTEVLNPPDIKIYEGDIMYIQNIEATPRSPTSSEQLKLVMKL